MYKARMMDSEQYPRVFILNKSVYITIHLHHDTAVVEHSEGVHNRSPLGNIVINGQTCLTGRRPCGHDELWEGDPRRKRFRRCDNEEEP
jgi:hypothetical protein